MAFEFRIRNLPYSRRNRQFPCKQFREAHNWSERSALMDALLAARSGAATWSVATGNVGLTIQWTGTYPEFFEARISVSCSIAS